MGVYNIPQCYPLLCASALKATTGASTAAIIISSQEDDCNNIEGQGDRDQGGRGQSHGKEALLHDVFTARVDALRQLDTGHRQKEAPKVVWRCFKGRRENERALMILVPCL